MSQFPDSNTSKHNIGNADNRDTPTPTALTEEQVTDYLRQNPRFLADKPDLIAAMTLPHHGGNGTVSLVERQISVLRKRNVALQERLNALLDNARSNDDLFEKTRYLILSLLSTRHFDDCIDVLFDSFQNDFRIQYFRLILLNPPGQAFPPPTNPQARIMERDAMIHSLHGIIGDYRTVCGQLTPTEREFIFGTTAREIGSVAVAPLRLKKQLLGVLALANSDADYYRNRTSSLFPNFIANVLARLLATYLRDA